MAYRPLPPSLSCPCGASLWLRQWDLIDHDTGEYRGAIWQTRCSCGRCYTIEVAEDPNYPREDA